MGPVIDGAWRMERGATGASLCGYYLVHGRALKDPPLFKERGGEGERESKRRRRRGKRQPPSVALLCESTSQA